MADLRSKQNIIDDLVDEIENLNSDISTLEHDVVHDVVITPPATEFEKLYRFFDYIRKCATYDGLLSLLNLADSEKVTLGECFAKKIDGTAYTVQEIENVIGEDVDNYASNFAITRDPGVKAVGVVRFYRRDSVSMTIPMGTYVETSGTSVVRFQTTVAIIGESPTYDDEEGLYYVAVAVEAVEVGINGNQPAGKVNVINPPITAMAIKCKNPSATTGGADEESSASVLERTRFAWGASNLNTIDGYTSFFETQSGVSDALVIIAADSRMLRALAGAVDIWVAATPELTYKQQVFTYQSGTETVLINNQPVSQISLIQDNVTLSSVPSGAFYLDKDTGVNRSSVRAQDSLVIDPGSPSEQLVHGRNYTLVYYYNSKIGSLQALLDQDEYNVVDDDVLIKEGDRLEIDLEAAFTVFPEIASKATVETEIETLLQTYFNGGTYGNTVYTAFGLGENVLSTNIRASILSEIRGIDRLETVGWELSVTGSDHQEIIPFDYYQYARFGSFTSL